MYPIPVKKNTFATHWDGSRLVYKSVLHNERGPAVVNKKDNIEKWYLNGVLHRTNGPAILNHKARKYYWYENGEFIKSEDTY